MNKYQEALTNLKTYIVDYDDEFGEDIYLYESYKEEFDLLQELVDEHKKLKDKATPKKLKNKTDKDGSLLWVCPTCGDVYMKFWIDVETISCRKHCDNCGQKLDWSKENE